MQSFTHSWRSLWSAASLIAASTLMLTPAAALGGDGNVRTMRIETRTGTRDGSGTNAAISFEITWNTPSGPVVDRIVWADDRSDIRERGDTDAITFTLPGERLASQFGGIRLSSNMAGSRPGWLLAGCRVSFGGDGIQSWTAVDWTGERWIDSHEPTGASWQLPVVSGFPPAAASENPEPTPNADGLVKEIRVETLTASADGSGTNATVAIETTWQTPAGIVIENLPWPDGNPDVRERGKTDSKAFRLSTPRLASQLARVRLISNMAGSRPGWLVAGCRVLLQGDAGSTWTCVDWSGTHWVDAHEPTGATWQLPFLAGFPPAPAAGTPEPNPNTDGMAKEIQVETRTGTRGGSGTDSTLTIETTWQTPTGEMMIPIPWSESRGRNLRERGSFDLQRFNLKVPLPASQLSGIRLISDMRGNKPAWLATECRVILLGSGGRAWTAVDWSGERWVDSRQASGASWDLPLATGFPPAAGPTEERPVDADEDGLEDEFEQRLLDTFQPRFRLDSDGNRPASPASWFVRNSVLWNNPDERGTPILDAPSVGSLLSWLNQNNFQEPNGRDLHLRLRSRTGNVPNDTLTWERIATEGSAVYGHVYRLDPNTVSVQYYMLLLWNETTHTSGFGNHEGEWLCVDFDVDITDHSEPRILRAIYHNHGRQLFVPADRLTPADSPHKNAYLEYGSNELWPAPGRRGYQDWPSGVTTNDLKFGGGEGPASAHKNVRSHMGDGLTWIPQHVPNLGEKDRPIEPDNEELVVVLRYPGTWGGWWKSFRYLAETSSPRGPVFNSEGKMWSRRFRADQQLAPRP